MATQFVINTLGVNLRSTPNSSNRQNIIAVLNMGHLVNDLDNTGLDGNWMHVQTEVSGVSTKGFVHSKNLATALNAPPFDIHRKLTAVHLKENNSQITRQSGSKAFPLGGLVHVGLGVGIAGYHNPARNTIPVELKSRFTPLQERKVLSIDWDIGYAVPLGETFEEGLTSSVGVSWNPKITKKRRVGVLVGYTLQEIKNAELVLISTGNVHRIYDNTIAHLLYFGICYSLW